MTSANVVYAILSTLKEVDSYPSGHLYAFLMGKVSLSQYQGMIDGLVKAKLLTLSNNLVTITPMGKELVSRVDSDLAKKPS